ncbi:hypothetical protein GCM10023086_33620 [Streptomyces venetus]|uniref:Uncharacterized protein n=1 Tax=Streptomyces venetus TaxID=1701086 RepID=A0ABP8FX91_9ACTN
MIAVTIPGFTAQASVRSAYGVFPAQVDYATCSFECEHECTNTCKNAWNKPQCRQKCRNRCMNNCLCTPQCSTKRYCDDYGTTVEVETCVDCEGNETTSQPVRVKPTCD